MIHHMKITGNCPIDDMNIEVDVYGSTIEDLFTNMEKVITLYTGVLVPEDKKEEKYDR